MLYRTAIGPAAGPVDDQTQFRGRAVRWRGLALAVLLAVWPSWVWADGLLVFAAASLKDALEPIAAQYQAETGTGVTLSLAGSSALARQIQHGAPADVFISANVAWMDHLAGRGLLAPGTRVDLVSNRLVLIGHGAQQPVTLAPGLDLAGLVGRSRLAIALADAVPAGIYAQAALDWLGAWPGIIPRTAQADNVRLALALVARGEARLGIVYASDARAEPGITVLGAFPAESHPPILYPAAALARGYSSAARRFLDHLSGPAAQARFAQHGFLPVRD